MSTAPSAETFLDLPDDFAPAREAGARVTISLDRQYHIRHIKLTFAGPRPSDEAVDRALRLCAAHAAAEDSSYDVFLNGAWVPAVDTPLQRFVWLRPYGDNHFLCFDAKLRQIGVRKNGGKRFVTSWPVQDIAALCRRAYAEHEPLPLDDPEAGDDPDGADGDLRAEVVRWIWYGYHSPEQINERIAERAEEEGDIDTAAMQAFAATVLARKRAAEATWPAVTDNDRLADAFADLSRQGILAVQWAGDSLNEGFDVVNERVEASDASGEQHTGACFFYSQDMDRALCGEGLMLAFGDLESDAAEDYVAIGQRVVEALRRHGLRPVWNGSDRQRIDLPDFRWQRRTPA